MRRHAWWRYCIKAQPRPLAYRPYSIKVARSVPALVQHPHIQKQLLSSSASLATHPSFEFWDTVHQLCAIFNNPQRTTKNLHQLNITPNHVVKALEILGTKNPQEALELFRWVEQKPSYTHNVETHMSIIHIIVSSNKHHKDPKDLIISMILKFKDSQKQLEEIIDSLRDLECKTGYKMKEVVFVVILKALAKLGLSSHSWRVFLDMKLHGYTLGYGVWNVMVNVCCKNGMMAEANMFFAALLKEKTQSPLDTYTFTQLICGHSKSGHMDEGLRVFHTMKRLGCEANCVTYNVLIDGLSKRGKLDEAFELLGQMLGQGITPTSRTFIGVLTYMCDAGKTNEALSVVNKMEKHGCAPDICAYSALVTGLSREGKMVKARQVFDKIPGLGLMPTIVTYNALIDGYCKSAEIEAAFDLVRTMEKEGCDPNVRTYTILIHGLCLLGRLEEAEMLLPKMVEKGIQPNIVTYTALIDGCSKLGRPDDGFRLLAYMMNNEDIAPCHGIVSALMSCVVVQEKGMQVEEMKEAMWHHVTIDIILTFLSKIIEHGCEPTVDAYRILVTRLLKVDKIFEVDQLILLMLGKGILPDKTILSAVRAIAIEPGSSLEAVAILKELIEKENGGEDASVYEGLILRIFKEGDVKVAMRLFESVLLKGFAPQQETWSMIFYKLLGENDTDMCLRCFKLLEGNGFHHSQEIHKALVKQLMQEGKTSEANLLVDEMLEKGYVL